MDQPHKVIINNTQGGESGGLAISEAVMADAMADFEKRNQNGFPIYLEDHTIMGKGRVSADGKHIEIEVTGDYPLAELMKENLIGFSTIRLAQRADTIIEESKDNKDV